MRAWRKRIDAAAPRNSLVEENGTWGNARQQERPRASPANRRDLAVLLQTMRAQLERAHGPAMPPPGRLQETEAACPRQARGTLPSVPQGRSRMTTYRR